MAGAVYWVGTDGNVWHKSSDGVVNRGKPINLYNTGFDAENFSAEASPINDPNPQYQDTDSTIDYGGGGGGSSGGGGGYDAQSVALLDLQEQRLKKQLGRADIGLNQGLEGLEDSYNKEKSRTNLERSRAIEGYNTQREDTTRDKLGSIGKVNTNARTLADSVRRILGLASGSGSSAYKFAAPNAIARTASTQRTNVNDTFGKNFRDLDTAEGRAKVDFQNLLDDLLEQRKSRESGLRAGVLDNKNQISNSLAELAAQRAAYNGGDAATIKAAAQGYISDIDSRNRKLDGLFARFRTPYKVKPVNVQKPELAQYTVDRATINSNNNNGQNPYNPYISPLKKKFNEESF